MAMANTFTEGFRKGFEVSGLDLSDKTNRIQISDWF